MPYSTSGIWGTSQWGMGSWGGSPGSFDLIAAIAYRENVVRLAFSRPVYFSSIYDEFDASDPHKYSMAAQTDTVGMDGTTARPVRVATVKLPDENDGIAPAALGRFVDVYLDRPMTPWPALYTITVTDLLSYDMVDVIPSAQIDLDAVYRELAVPQVDTAHASRDLANPQTLTAARGTAESPDNPQLLGTLRVDASGDYAFDEGIVNLKKRVLRRLYTRKGAFLHLPNYGVGIPSYGKKLASPVFVQSLAADAQAQISSEPDVAKCLVKPIINPNTPGLVRFQVIVQPKTGKPAKFDVPFKVPG